MSSLWQSPIGKLRAIGMLEGASFIALTGVGMLLKYMMENPWGVKIAGPIHGLLFIWLLVMTAAAVFGEGWSVKRGAAVFAASLVPFGPFLLDKRLNAWQAEFDDSDAN